MKSKYVVTEINLHVSRHISKLGHNIYAFSTVPGNEAHQPKLNDEPLSNVHGTCSKHCEGCAKDGACYAWKAFKLHHNHTVKAWSENTLLLRSGKLFEMLDYYINNINSNPKKKPVETFRINTSGEIESVNDLIGWNNLAKKFPSTTFSVYTKNYEALEEFIKLEGDSADNFVINVSQWNHCADEFLKKYPNKFNVFEYDGTNRAHHEFSKEDVDRLAKLPHCPSVGRDGKSRFNPDGSKITCDQCKKCYRKTRTTTAVYSH